MTRRYLLVIESPRPVFTHTELVMLMMKESDDWPTQLVNETHDNFSTVFSSTVPREGEFRDMRDGTLIRVRIVARPEDEIAFYDNVRFHQVKGYWIQEEVF